MDNFTFYAPTYFSFGKDTEMDTGKYVKRFGGSKVLVHFGGGSVVRSGLLDRVKHIPGCRLRIPARPRRRRLAHRRRF